MPPSLVADAIPVTFWPALFSAAAALFAATTAVVVAWLHFRNARDAVRPDLVLEGWGYGDYGTGGTIRVHKLHNFGRGPALHIAGHVCIPGVARTYDEGAPVAGLLAQPLLVLKAGGEAEIDWEVRLSWKTAEPGVFPYRLPVDLSVFCADLHDRVYKTTYHLLAFRPPIEISGACMATNGLLIRLRDVSITPSWRVGLTYHLGAMRARSTRLHAEVSKSQLWQDLDRIVRSIARGSSRRHKRHSRGETPSDK